MILQILAAALLILAAGLAAALVIEVIKHRRH